jgi:hypothetical protein
MTYGKSILTGLIAAAVAAMAIGIWFQGTQYRIAMSQLPGDSLVVVHWHKARIVCVLTLAFAAGFW